MLEPTPLLMAGEIPGRQRCLGDALPNYWNPSRGEPDVTFPSTSTYSATIVYGAGDWGSWYQVELSVPCDCVLTALHFSKVATASVSFWIQIGIGAPGSEVVIATVGQHVLISGSGANPFCAYTQRLAPYKVPAGSRIAARGLASAGHLGGRLNLSAIKAAPDAMWYSPWPNTYIGGTRVTGTGRAPAAPSWQAVQGGGVQWTQFLASAPSDMLFNAAEFNPANSGGGDGNRFQLGVGPAGDVTPLSEVPMVGAGLVPWCSGYQEVGRKSLILSGETVWGRLMGPSAGPWSMACYFEYL